MVGTSLATAPAFILAQICDLVDLDGPTFLAADREPGAGYDNGNRGSGPKCGDAASAGPVKEQRRGSVSRAA